MKVHSAFSAGIGILFLGLLYYAGGNPALWAFKHGVSWAPVLVLCALIPIAFYVLLPDSTRIRIVHINFPIILLLATIAVACMWIFRQRLILPPPEGNGDGIFLLEQIPVYTELFGFRASFDEILELYVHSKFYLICKSIGLSILDSYAILSCVSGFFYVSIVLRFLNDRPLWHWLLGFALLILTPAIELFFGYVEHYDAPTVLIAAVAMLVLRMELPGPRQWMILGGLAALGAAFHMFAGIALLPLAFYCYAQSENRKAFFRNALLAAIPAGVILGGVWIYFLFLAQHPISIGESFFVKPPFYPWRQIVSLKHFLDTFNLLVLGMPALLCILPLLLLIRPDRRTFQDWRIRFTLIGFLGFLGASFLIHPLLGFPADWDLFTIFQVYGNLLLFQLLIALERVGRVHMANLVPGILLVGLISTGLWVHRNHMDSEESRITLDRILTNSSQFLQEIQNDKVFKAAQGPRKKTLVQVKLFLVGAKNNAKRHQPGLLAEIEREAREFDRFVLLPDSEYRAEYPTIWGRLTDLNRRLEELPP
ncbi:MAG: hypothetical protein JNM27_08435 [Leptospirales bacterium]|nr:hypothetical protein [Leptospirales bacterium]